MVFGSLACLRPQCYDEVIRMGRLDYHACYSMCWTHCRCERNKLIQTTDGFHGTMRVHHKRCPHGDATAEIQQRQGSLADSNSRWLVRICPDVHADQYL